MRLKNTIKTSFEAKKNFNDTSIKALQKRYNEIQNKLNVLLEVRIELQRMSMTKKPMNFEQNSTISEIKLTTLQKPMRIFQLPCNTC